MDSIAHARHICTNHVRLKAEWRTDFQKQLQQDAVTVEFGDEPGAVCRFHPTTGGFTPIAGNAAEPSETPTAARGCTLTARR